MIGSTIGHYKVEEKLGEGGMGVVYKAVDTKLDRTVALKFLPDHVSAGTEELERFVLEAKAAAALNHPNICTIYGIEEAQGKNFIVMEFVDGQMLQEKKASLSHKQSIDIGIQIAEGLAAAHEKGIVHRDIKPENIMVRKDGRVQIMDFGLAKLRGASRLTKEGSTVGTAGYMSPEQVQGQETDHKSDIFSLGVLLYEMLSGQPPFKGVHETAIAYEIVNVDSPPMSSFKTEIPPELDAIVLDCLEKDPKERTQSAGQVALELKRYRRESSRSRASRITAARPMLSGESRGIGTAEPAVSHGMTRRETIAWSLVLTLIVAVGTFVFLSSYDPEVRVTRASLLPPERTTFDSRLGGHIAVSPNGKFLAFVALDSVARSVLWVRPLSALSGQELNGTEDAKYPFWSQDSRFIGFFAEGKLKKIEVSGGPVQTICDAPNARGGAWNRDGVILLSPTAVGPLSRVSAAGGSPSIVTTLDSARGDISHRWPFFLPDGEHFLYTSQTTQAGDAARDAICLGSLDSPETTLLINARSNSVYASGHILFMRERSLMAQPFDDNGLSVTDDAFPVAEGVYYWADRNKAIFSVSENGVLAYQTGVSIGTSQLVWFDQNGKELGKIGEPGFLGSFKISPDQRNLAIEILDPKSRNVDLWVYDFSRKVRTRFTFDPGSDILPVWSPDGRNIAFASIRGRSANYGLYQRASSGASDEEVLLATNTSALPNDWSIDGRYLAYTAATVGGVGQDLWLVSMSGDPKSLPFLQTEFIESRPAFSPDGRWIAYNSNESGTQQVYVRPFPGPGGKYQVSTSTGTRPRWRRDGKELYYLGNGNTMMAAEVESKGQTFVVGSVRELFECRPLTGGVSNSYDVTPDGKRFLINTVVGENSSSPITLVVNWDQEIKRK